MTCAHRSRKPAPTGPKTNGKVERYHRILLNEWAYTQDWNNDTQRSTAYAGFTHFYNHHHNHGSLNYTTPMATLHTLTNQDNLPGMHT